MDINIILVLIIFAGTIIMSLGKKFLMNKEFSKMLNIDNKNAGRRS